MPTYSVEEIKKAQQIALDNGLEGATLFSTLEPEYLRTVCNGIGAEWMPGWARDILDVRYMVMRIPAMIHDMQYHLGDGTDEDFHQANQNLKENGYRMAKAQYSWYNPLRYRVMIDARRLCNVCEAFGRKAYNEAIDAHGKESER